jgi:hypothetical protein
MALVLLVVRLTRPTLTHALDQDAAAEDALAAFTRDRD